jgi:hypothetical protein
VGSRYINELHRSSMWDIMGNCWRRLMG